MNRDSKLWWVMMIGSAAAAISTNFNLIDPLLPADSVATIHAWVNLVALLVGVVSGKLATSPLPGKYEV